MGWQTPGVGRVIDYASGSLAGLISEENRRLISVANAAGLHVAGSRRTPVNDLPARFTDLDMQDTPWAGCGDC